MNIDLKNNSSKDFGNFFNGLQIELIDHIADMIGDSEDLKNLALVNRAFCALVYNDSFRPRYLTIFSRQVTQM